MCKPNDAKMETSDSLNTTGAALPLAPAVTNKKWVLSRRPNGLFHPDKDVELVTESLSFDSCANDEVIIETSMLSVDAFIRTMLDEQAYHGATPIGGTLMALGYGKVIHAGSNSKKRVGSMVVGGMGAQTFCKVKASETTSLIQFPFMSPTASLGLMGLTTGLTAYTGVFHVCKRPSKGETVVVTAAAGAVGSVAAQLAKSTGARVVGIAGGKQKQAFLLNDLGLDGAVDYKGTESTLEEQLEKCCPNGIDFVYDNVGGEILDALLYRINPKARVVICGAISQYSGNLNNGKVQGPSNYLKLAERGAEMKGFNVMQYMYRLPFSIFGMFWLYMRGKVNMKEHIEQGIESFPMAMSKMFVGGHVGKLMVNLQQPPSS
eukprot:CAMPEP_0198141708 /NCGR_PEP_ID=MMETSP1443-20131203/4656_1 /TAXON_ID=186043 /ORGANISM="Entomoneis sp., Strain CCMP2396" /LENGTH=375 /DNA_ID=CAMNT_0043804527 /DNA_START=35 /DNA_END=1162 /DNA_ORIENTATION=+